LRKVQSGLEVGEVVASLLDHLSATNVIFLADNEPRAIEIAQALAHGAPDCLVVYCPGSDALPGEDAPASAANVGQRTSALRRIRATLAAERRMKIALISTGDAAARLYAPPDRFDAAPPVIRTGREIELAEMATKLESLGYVADDRVDEPGEFALNGQVIDVFPADGGEPYRIQEQDGRIASIRPYDAASQLTSGECEVLELGRAAEPEIGSDGVPLIAHLPGAALAMDSGADKRRKQFLALAADVQKRQAARTLKEVCGDGLWANATAAHPRVELVRSAGEAPPRFVETRSPVRSFAGFARNSLAAGETLLLLGTARDLRFLSRRMAKSMRSEPQRVSSWSEAKAAPAGSLLMLEMPVPRGFRHHGIVGIAAADLLGSRAQRDVADAPNAAAQLFGLVEIRRGDVIVHEDHGVAVVVGLEPLPGEAGDAIVLRHAGDARRLVPVAEANKIWRYGSDEDAVTLDKLDGSSWTKRREDVSARIAETARELVSIAAERAKRSAPVIEPDPAKYETFVAGFPFSESADQARAIAAVQADLASGKPMDRLVVGDVGYGKTEVALRAAAAVALAGGQVAIAAPTTVLVRQHLETFAARFNGLGITAAGLSRLSTAADRKRVAAGLSDGTVSVVVGTGAIAGKGIAYRQLDLVVIDEEQKFGAADKAKLRALGAQHVLTLSATPIPRTLQSALVGLQQISVIATPPARRQPIRTTVASFDGPTMRTALLRERSRGGQSFVVVPRIDDMDKMADELCRLAPELEVLQAHGKLPAAAIDDVMVRFAAGAGDVLLATNIIEAGLDVPRANTMIVWRAERFGLSQLHQLRGRVGRGARRGQVYLTTERGAQIATRTLARLKTLEAFDRLGAGFAISARDLDMRGAGDLLSDEQTGHVKLIGVDLYQHLLALSVRQARGENADDWLPVLNADVSGSFPPDWIADEDVRIGLYVRLARITGAAELDLFEDELVDRFGELPEEASGLVALARLRLAARSADIEKIEFGPAALAFTPRNGAAEDYVGATLERSGRRLLLKEAIPAPLERLSRAEEVLANIA
jgi:transcription-repair coupling factor (superfamily II helicase)